MVCQTSFVTARLLSLVGCSTDEQLRRRSIISARPAVAPPVEHDNEVDVVADKSEIFSDVLFVVVKMFFDLKILDIRLN